MRKFEVIPNEMTIGHNFVKGSFSTSRKNAKTQYFMMEINTLWNDVNSFADGLEHLANTLREAVN